MRIIMPLFEFIYDGDEFTFHNGYSLRHFDAQRDIPKNIDGLSRMDSSYISLENWALVAENPEVERYKEEISLLLIAFKIYALSNVFIKWRFCAEDSKHSTRLEDIFRPMLLKTNTEVSQDDLPKVNDGFKNLLEMYSISNRTKNALYFVWRGFSSDKHIDSYIFLVCVLEALFSSEESENIEQPTKILIKRIQSFLKGEKGCGGDQIKRIYKIRSDMVHGRIQHTDKNDLEQRKKNIDNLGKLEVVIFACLKKLLDDNIYTIYSNAEEKEKHLKEISG